MNTAPNPNRFATNGPCRLGGLLALCACVLLSSTRIAQSQTTLCGTINSATLTPAGNPYIIACDSTVPAGQTLTIQPGVIVWLGSNVTLTVRGLVQAVGIPANRIKFQSPPGAPPWNAIYLVNQSTNRFKYCDFQNGTAALSIGAYGGGYTMVAEVFNCTFRDCLSYGIYGEAYGLTIGSTPVGNAIIKPVIKNCTFDSTSNGVVIVTSGANFVGTVRYGYASADLRNNIFKNLTGVAFDLRAGGYSGGGIQEFVNNVIVNTRIGVLTRSPYNSIVLNNVLAGNAFALQCSGGQNPEASFNCFYDNGTNFTGYPTTYGQAYIQNRNGTPTDLFFNIFEEPQFVGTNDFHLATTSPCVDAGAPDSAFCDMCFPPSLGNQFPDLGAYGGPDACNWLDTVPKLPAVVSMSRSNNVIRLCWDAIPRSTYQIQFATNILTESRNGVCVMTNAWLDFTNGRVLATQKATSAIVATNTSRPSVFFRAVSLGRTPGN